MSPHKIPNTKRSQSPSTQHRSQKGKISESKYVAQVTKRQDNRVQKHSTGHKKAEKQSPKYSVVVVKENQIDTHTHYESRTMSELSGARALLARAPEGEARERGRRGAMRAWRAAI